MMQSIAIILQIYLICIIVKLYDCTDHAESTEFFQMTLNRYKFMLPSNAEHDNLVYVVNDRRKFVQNNANNNNDANLYAQYEHKLDESSQPNRNLNNINSNNATVMIQNKADDSGNRSENENIRLSAIRNGNRELKQNARIKRNVERQDICDTNCVCKNEMNFLTVECNLNQHFTFGPSKLVQPSATSILIHLAPEAEFILDGNVFEGNKLNRITIEGSGFRSGEELVEIRPHAFYGNDGPFPEIDIVNVHSVILHNSSFYGEFKLNITNCSKVWIYAEAFSNTTFHGHFENIKQFEIYERAFAKSTAKIFIRNSKIDELKRLDAALKEIKFSDSHIRVIKKGAFDVLAINSIVFENCEIDLIERRAITEKLLSNHFALIGCTIETIETEAISGSGVTDLILEHNSINSVKQRAIAVTSVNTLIENNTINFLERFWFGVKEWSNVTIANNHFGVYHQMAIEISKNPVQCIFKNNFITKASPDSLNFKSPHCHINQISFNQPCLCDSSHFKQISLNDIRSESFCKIDETLAHCYNATLFNVLAYEREICGDSEGIDCLKNRANAKPNGYFVDLNRLFNQNEKLFYLYLVGGTFIILVICILIIILVRRCLRTRKQLDDSPMRDIMLMESLHSSPTVKQTLRNSQMSSNSFSNSDIVVIQQTLNTMKQKYPREIYDQVHNNTTKLITGNLTETDKVLTIDEIVRNLIDCENTGTDFVAFTDILYSHLGSKDDHDPIYFEPNAHFDNEQDRFQHTNDVYRRTDINAAARGDGGEHIYAEPILLQQPLLTNEYTDPIDRNDNVTHLYTEPVSRPCAIENVPATSISRPTYATTNITNDIIDLYTQPSTSRQSINKDSRTEAIASTSAGLTNFTNNTIPKISASGESFRNSIHSSSQESNHSHSDHSGGSGVTLRIDEPID